MKLSLYLSYSILIIYIYIHITAPVDFIDSMDEKNYITTSLPKPMGIVFEENDSEFGGIFALEITDGSNAEADGAVRPGDQLVAVGSTKVSGLAFEEALGTIIDSPDEKTKLEDLVLLCSNCHRMVHRSKPWLSIEGLKRIIKIH